MIVNVFNLIQRILGKYICDKRPYDFRKIYPCMYWYYHMSYFVWTIFNAIQFCALTSNCFKVRTWSMFLWALTLLIGLKSVLMVAYGVLYTIFYLPYKKYRNYNSWE